jgi:hypothetical protein
MQISLNLELPLEEVCGVKAKAQHRRHRKKMDGLKNLSSDRWAAPSLVVSYPVPTSAYHSEYS